MQLPSEIRIPIEEALHDVGLNKSETAVLVFLIQTEIPLRVSHIAKKMRTNRTTLYGILKALTEKGLVSSIENGGVRTYQSIRPDLLVDYLGRAKDRLSADAEKIKEIIPAIRHFRTKGINAYPSVQFFEGLEGLKQAYEDTITNNPSKTIYGFTGTEAIYRVMDSKWVDRYLGRRAKNKIMWYDLATDSTASRKMKLRDEKEWRVTKLFPPGYDFDIELGIYEDKVIIGSFSEENPLAVLIEDKKIAELMKAVFKYIDSTLTA